MSNKKYEKADNLLGSLLNVG